MTRITTLTDAIFDVGGVLYTLDYDRMLKNFSRLCREPIDKIKAVLYEEETFRMFERGKLSSFEYYKTVVRGLGKKLDFDDFKRLFNSFIIERKTMFDLLSKLRKHINIHFLSNTNEINAEAIKDALESISSHITYSFRTGYLKPDHRIFRIALEKASKNLKEILYIDDSEENIRAARELGIPSYLFESEEDLLKTLEQFGIDQL
jgi:HAD superfamily hydrolase (TIGR01509 family)